jgi:nucleoside-diphosphate-sugar epimerase
MRALYAGRHAAVIGATGFIGRWVVRALLDRDAIVHAIVRDDATAQRARGFLPEGVRIASCDATDRHALGAVLHDVRPAITFNLAGYGVAADERDEATAMRVNVRLVEAVCAAIAAVRDQSWTGQAIVHTGSSAEYAQTDEPLTEASAEAPRTLYGKTKLAGTRALGACCRESGIRGVTARLFMVYGAGEHAHRLFPSLIRAAREGAPIALSEGRQRLDFTYVGDVAEGLLRLGVAAAEPGEVVNLATGRLTAVRTFVEAASEILGLSHDQLRIGSIDPRADDVRYGPVRTERLHQLTDWVPDTTIADGIRRTLEHDLWAGPLPDRSLQR